jgi:hypothetical protein
MCACVLLFPFVDVFIVLFVVYSLFLFVLILLFSFVFCGFCLLMTGVDGLWWMFMFFHLVGVFLDYLFLALL